MIPIPIDQCFIQSSLEKLTLSTERKRNKDPQANIMRI